MWLTYAFGSVFFAGITAILAKVGMGKTDSSLATAIRTIVVVILAHGIFSGFPEYDHADWGKIIALFSVIGTCDRSVVALLFQGAAAR